MSRCWAKTLIAAVLLTIGSAVWAAEPAPLAVPQWLRDVTRVAYSDLPNRDRFGDWPDKFIADLGQSKVQLFFSRCHSGAEWNGLAWKSRFGAVDPAMGSHDGTREVVALCHKAGLRYITYYWAQREPKALADEHPEWRSVNAAGKQTGYFCVNTPYRQLLKDRCVELVTDVGVDGVFFDMFHARADECYCPACKDKFRRASGKEPPLKEDFGSLLWQQWVDFKYRTIEEALLEINRAIKAARPQAALVANTWNAWVIRNPHNIRNSIRVAESVDGMLEETGWYDSVDPSFFAFPTLHNFMSWHLAGLCKGKVPLMWSAGSFMGGQSIGYTETAIRTAVMHTNGSTSAQTTVDRDVFHRYMADIAARDESLRGARLEPWCGLVVSEKTELWYGRDDPKQRYLKGVYGAFQAMMERHLPVSLVTDRELELGRVEPHRVLFAPNCAALSKAEMDTLRDFVRGGGGLVATYETSLYDEHGQRRKEVGLADLLGAKLAGELDTQQVRFSWASPRIVAVNVQFPATQAWSKDPEILSALGLCGGTQPAGTVAQSLAVGCRNLLADPLPGSSALLKLTTLDHDKRANKVERGQHAAVIFTKYGKGKVLYLPSDVTWSFFRFHRQWLSRLIELCLREAAAAPPPVEAAAPSIVQVMTHRQGERLVVHLLNDISSLGRSQNVAGETVAERTEVLPIRGIRLTFRDRTLKRFRLVPGGETLVSQTTAEGLQVTVPELLVHALVVAER